MDLKQQAYSTLVVSASETFTSSLTALLTSSRCEPIHVADNIGAASRKLSSREYDFIIINSPLPDDSGIHFAIDSGAAGNAVVLLLVRSELHDEIYDQVYRHGVLTLPKPIVKSTFLTALNWMASLRERLRKSEAKALSVEDKMKEIRLVNRAKWLLIKELHMDEPQAHRYIEKQAMDTCTSKKEVAENLIRMYS